MARLRVADVDAVKQNRDLFVVATAHTDVGLGTDGPSLSDIDAYGVLQQIVNTLHRRRLNVLAAQYSYHSRLLTKGQRRPRTGDLHLVERLLPAVNRVRGHLGHVVADAVGLRVGQRSNAQRADENLSAQA